MLEDFKTFRDIFYLMPLQLSKYLFLISNQFQSKTYFFVLGLVLLLQKWILKILNMKSFRVAAIPKPEFWGFQQRFNYDSEL